LFGNRTKGTSAVVTEQRQIGDLARVVGKPELLAKLRHGKSVLDVIEEPALRPIALVTHWLKYILSFKCFSAF
jgi:hypothetical protein